MKPLRSPLVASCLLLLPATSIAESGLVVEAGTNRPMAGAVVMAMWSGRSLNPVSSSSECYSFAITTADDRGRFSLSAVAPNAAPLLHDKQRSIDAYLPGYVRPNGPVRVGTLDLSKYSGSVLARLRYLENHPFLYCVPPGKRKAALPLLLAIYTEAGGIASTEEEMSILSRMKANLVTLLGGEIEFRRRTGEGAAAASPTDGVPRQ